jgi:hypothetical protein
MNNFYIIIGVLCIILIFLNLIKIIQLENQRNEIDKKGK